MNSTKDYPYVTQWLGSWIDQLSRIGEADEHHVIRDEIRESEQFVEHRATLRLLDTHLRLASEECLNFGECMAEKKTLPPTLDEANVVVLNKLAEVRAIVGLSRLGVAKIRFVSTPDLMGLWEDRRIYVEVTRLNRSLGKRSDVWDESYGDLETDGYLIGGMNRPGGRDGAPKAQDAIGEALYREVEEKNRQLKGIDSTESCVRLIWISLGRDYFAAGKYELPGVDQVNRTDNHVAALQQSLADFGRAGLYEGLKVAVSPGRDHPDVVGQVGVAS